MSIPDWTYNEALYKDALASEAVEIVTDPVKGKGLRAKHAIKKGDQVLRERALCASQNLDDMNRSIPICAHCLVSLETPRQIVRRCTSSDEAAAEIPCVSTFRPRHTRRQCRNVRSGCTFVFCSDDCENEAWLRFHRVGCRGGMNSVAQKAFDAFMAHPWIANGIDLTDTHALAWKFACIWIARVRFPCKENGVSEALPLSIEIAFLPIAQLIRAPITKFHFTYLLAEEWEAQELKVTGAKVDRWGHFLRFKDKPDDNPIVKHAKASGPRTEEVVQTGHELVSAMLSLTESERQFFNEIRWSELLGAVLLNGQERSPNSPYTSEFHDHVCLEGQEIELKKFHRGLRTAGLSTRDFDTSTRGQGIYAIGACFNHSCLPNIQVSYCERNDETLVVTALRDIEKGEELCISYIDEDAPFEERQQQLSEHYLFTCCCSKCVVQGVKSTGVTA